MVLVGAGGEELVVARLDDRPDLAALDALARLHLAARRAGGRLVLRDPPAALRELLDLAGLTGVIEVAP